jgi:hypothetical protein
MSFTAIKALTWGDGALTCKAVIITRHYSPDWRVPDNARGNEKLGSLDVTLAIAHGLANSRISGTLPIQSPVKVSTTLDGVSSWITLDDQREAVHGDQLDLSPETCLTITIAPSVDFTPNSTFDTRTAVHVTIGPDTLGLPADLFAEQVFVDERPSEGGGLPDFWEAAIAQVITSLVRYPNVTSVIVSGSAVSGAQTLTRLQTAARWTDADVADDLSDKLGFRTATIRASGGRIGSNVHFVNDRADTVRIIINQLRARDSLASTPDIAVELHRDPPRLKRTLDMDELALGPEAGCKVSTAYEAFPVALELARQVEEPTSTDQAGRPFKELVDFRIILTQPQMDRIPRFHLPEHAEFEKYFDKQFLQRDGLFKASLSKGDQLNLVLKHVGEIVDQGVNTSSRRGILVVPHTPHKSLPLSPLGLVSVRLIPRASSDAGGTTIDYSFTWRTVEALVGLPYSLYGSIRFAEYLTDEVRELVHPKYQRSLRMGRLSYIAHSLHIFLDEYHQKIARRVVNDDTG